MEINNLSWRAQDKWFIQIGTVESSQDQPTLLPIPKCLANTIVTLECLFLSCLDEKFLEQLQCPSWALEKHWTGFIYMCKKALFFSCKMLGVATVWMSWFLFVNITQYWKDMGKKDICLKNFTCVDFKLHSMLIAKAPSKIFKCTSMN